MEVRAAIWLVLWLRIPVKAGIPGALSVDLYSKRRENTIATQFQNRKYACMRWRHKFEWIKTILYVHRKGWQLIVTWNTTFSMQSHAVDNGCVPKLTPVKRT